MRAVDRTFGVLLILGGVGHSIGSYLGYQSNQMELLWALCASLFVFLLGAVNLLRAGRPNDATVAWICLFGLLGWIPTMIRFAMLNHNPFEIHALIFMVLTLGLLFFSIRTIRTAHQ